MVLSKCLSSTYFRKFATVCGARVASRSSEMTPKLVCNLTMGYSALVGRNDAHALNDDRLERYVLVAAAVAGGCCDHLVHDVHAFDHPPEHAVAESLLCRSGEVQELVVRDVDEELRGRRVRIRRARHRERADLVLQPVLGFVGDRVARLL